MSGSRSLPCFGEREQFLVGHRTPQEVGQPAGQGEVVELAVRRSAFSRRNRKCGETSTALRPTRIACSNEYFLIQLGLHAGEKRLDVLVRHRPPKRPPREVAEDPLGIGQRLLRDDLEAVGIVGAGHARLRQVAEERRWLGGGQDVEQRSFDVDPLDDQARSLVVVGADFLDRGRQRAAGRRRRCGCGSAAPAARRTR